MAKSGRGSVTRRGFLKGAAAGAAVFVAPRPGAVPPPSAAAEIAPAVQAPSRIVEHPAGDFMVDVLKTLGMEYVTTNPGSSFQGLHESLINYGGNTMPEMLTCLHEESAVAMAHGYAKIEGKPIIALVHANVGLQHASMAIYNAYADRVPVYIIAGNHVDAAFRQTNVMWYHSAVDMASSVRDFIKWDDAPASLGHFAESAVRAYRVAVTPPMAPVVLVVDSEMQEAAFEPGSVRIPKLTSISPPAGDIAAVKEAARMLVSAERPMIVAQRCARTPAGIQLLVELAEALQAPVGGAQSNAVLTERVNFPSRHPLAGLGYAAYQADVTLCLEVQDMSPIAREAAARGAKTISISDGDLVLKTNYQDSQRMAEVDLAMAADAEATLPLLIEEVKRMITPDRKRALLQRGTLLAEAHQKAREQNVADAAYGWDASPISLARLSAELWPLIRNEDWSLVSWQGFIGNWPSKLWNIDKHHQYIGGPGAGGIGYGAPAAVGAALANRKHGRLSINIQCDGDLNYAPGVLWTAVHHKIPLLTIMHNNRGYHAEVMFVQTMANLHNRGVDRAYIGTTLRDPNIDYARMARAYGMYGEGPIENPADLAPALKRGVERVKHGEPVLIDVVTQPRG